ncbi:hypothetical protein [Segetibacter koreensis]|uniref:hypothetical protein n=1 Tax=Segetibacter koreensis TaxID=398037 RepID=UPI0003723013|nr:hypothetical protein [Segetibacter koreensis]
MKQKTLQAFSTKKLKLIKSIVIAFFLFSMLTPSVNYAGIAASSCLDWLTDVSLLFIEKLSLSCIVFPILSERVFAVVPVTCQR